MEDVAAMLRENVEQCPQDVLGAREAACLTTAAVEESVKAMRCRLTPGGPSLVSAFEPIL